MQFLPSDDRFVTPPQPGLPVKNVEAEGTEPEGHRLLPDEIHGMGCQKVLKALREKSGIRLKRLDVPQCKAALEILRRFSSVRHRMARHTRNLLREYHKKGLIDTPIANRDVRDIALDMTPAEAATMDQEEAENLARQAQAQEERGTIQELLKKIARIGTNTKTRKLVDVLKEGFADGYDSAIVFTPYADTMNFLREHLAQEFPGETVACYSGAGGKIRDKAGFWTECSKEQIKQLLKAGTIQFLVCTDAAAEGLNFQTCGFLVNYDLSWNSMKVQQCIGRIGQKYPKIRVVNLAYAETIEADVYFALGERINFFEGLVGRLQPILSRLPKRFEEVVLERKENREAAWERFRADLEQSARDAEETALDIDEVAVDAFDLPSLPAPALTLEDLDQALNLPGVLPPGAEWRKLDSGSYALRLPGMRDEARVTTRAEVVEDHFESHQFLSPGGELFEALGSGWEGGEETD